MGKDLFLPAVYQCQVIEGNGLSAVPGFMDAHVHIIGGGGEGGFQTRTPEIQLSKITTAGVTTVFGLLGTDGITRHVESLLAKARGLEMKVSVHTSIPVLMRCPLLQSQGACDAILF